MSSIKLSIFDIFKIGPGPSSSHTIGPMCAANRFLKFIEGLPEEKIKSATNIEIHLYGSLSATGKGHGTDRAITAGILGWQPQTCDSEEFEKIFKEGPETYSVKLKGKEIPFSSKNIHFDAVQHSFPFQNTVIMKLMAQEEVLLEKEFYSIGGGFIKYKGEVEENRPEPPYPYGNMAEFKKIIGTANISLDELMIKNEQALTGASEREIYKKLDAIISVMFESVENGIHSEGLLPGPIGLARKAHTLYKRAHQPTHDFPVEHIPDRFLVF